MAQAPADWLNKVDGATILKEMFNELSETRVAYDKVKHSVAITEWLIDNASGDLKELSDALIEPLEGPALSKEAHV